MNKENKKKKKIKVNRKIIKIYLIGNRFAKSRSLPLTEEQVEQFYEELNDEKSIMEFDNFYFAKARFNYAIVKDKKIKIEV